MRQWLGDTKWDVIHFNFGLHDLCYCHPDSKVYGNRDKEKGILAVSLEEYERNLESIVEQLKKTQATLVWASTTMVPEKEAGRKLGDDKNYNEVAAKVMQKHGIRINDLYATSVGFENKLFVKPADVHFTKEGSAKLADQVVEAVIQAAKIAK